MVIQGTLCGKTTLEGGQKASAHPLMRCTPRTACLHPRRNASTPWRISRCFLLFCASCVQSAIARRGGAVQGGSDMSFFIGRVELFSEVSEVPSGVFLACGQFPLLQFLLGVLPSRKGCNRVERVVMGDKCRCRKDTNKLRIVNSLVFLVCEFFRRRG